MLDHQTKRPTNRFGFSQCSLCCVILALLVPMMSGCLGGNQGKSGAGRAAGAAIEPEDLIGRWKLSVANHGVQSDVGIIQISYDEKRSEDKYSIKLLGLGENASLFKINSVKITDDGAVSFEIGWPQNLISNFSGRLDGDDIWGSYWQPHVQLVPSKLERTELEKIEKVEQVPVSHLEDFMKAQASLDSYVTTDALVEKANRSPLLFEIYEALSMHFKNENFSKEKVQEFIDQYRKGVEIWGPRLDFVVNLNVGNSLAKQNLYPELAQSLLEKADSKITDDHPMEFGAKIADAWISLGKPELALKRIPKLQEADPTNPGLLLLYAKANEKANKPDEAMLAYAKVAVTPGFEQQMRTTGTELPNQAAFRLWKAGHNNLRDGFEEYARLAYIEVMKSYAPKRTPAKRDPKAKVSMVELFTSSGNIPCIGADVAVEALRQAYTPQEVVVLKYQQHSPYVDALATPTTAARMSYYGVTEAPSLAFDGQVVEQKLGIPIATGFSHIYGPLAASVEADAKTTSPISIQLTATRKGDEIEIKADVSGIQEVQHQPRLYLALIENGIYYPGPSGIMMHNCVVRTFAGGAKGLALPKGDSSHIEKISLTQLKQELLTHLSQFEMEQKLPLKPMDFRQLQVVAFVQPQFTRVVLQASLVEVTGDVPPEVKAESKTEPVPDTKPDEKPKVDEKPEVPEKPAVPEKPEVEKSPADKPAAETPAKPEPAKSDSEPKAGEAKTNESAETPPK
jgi:tetratricopeptide (TPR) repeat protein